MSAFCYTEGRVPAMVDLTGWQFSRLTVTEWNPENDLWNCKCRCGRQIAVREPYLMSGVTTSCGCRRNRIIDLTGQRFGYLTVIEPVLERAQDKSVQWRCRCDCGKDVTVSSNKLRMNHTKSCGCKRMDMVNAGKTRIDGTYKEIVLSKKKWSNNTSGRTGVANRAGKWAAYITYAKKHYWLGQHDTMEEAIAAREQAEARIRERLEWLTRQTELQQQAEKRAEEPSSGISGGARE